MRNTFRINPGIQNNSDNNTAINAHSLISITSLYNKMLSGVKIPDLGMITIQLVDMKELESVIPTNKLTRVCVIYELFNWAHYEEQKTQYNKAKYMLDFIYQTIIKYANEFNWEIAPFEEAYNKTLETNLIYEDIVIKPKKSKDKRYSAEVLVEYKREHKLFSIIFREQATTNIIKIELIKMSFSVLFWRDLFYKLIWIDNDEVLITDKHEEINHKVTLSTQKVEIFFTPKENDEKYLQDELILLNPNS